MQVKRENSISIYDALFQKLSCEGLRGIEIPRLMEDVFSIIGHGGNFTVASVNHALERRGWKKRIVDELTFDLIALLLETEYEFEVKRHTLQ